MSEIFARVTELEGSVVGGLVELSNGDFTVTGRVATENDNQFAVEWQDGQLSIENKSDYELVVEAGIIDTFRTLVKDFGNDLAVSRNLNLQDSLSQSDVDLMRRGLKCKTCKGSMRGKPYSACTKCTSTGVEMTPEQAREIALKSPHSDFAPKASVTAAEGEAVSENPAQPAGWAVPPVDAEAYPGGELIEVEMEKREETAQWEDAQNRAPIDAENPAQPAGYAVPPASGAPIPGQGADGLMTAAGVVANVYAEDVTAEGGFVELENGSIRMTGKVITSNDSEFLVNWEDDTNTVENKSDYNLILTDPEGDEEEVESDFEDFEE